MNNENINIFRIFEFVKKLLNKRFKKNNLKKLNL